jgi:hypothetical protein
MFFRAFIFVLSIVSSKVSASSRLNQIFIDIHPETSFIKQALEIEDIYFIVFSFLGKENSYNLALVDKTSMRLSMVCIRAQPPCMYCDTEFDSEDFLSKDIQALACSHRVHNSCLIEHVSSCDITDEQNYFCKKCQDEHDEKKLIYYEDILFDLVSHKLMLDRIVHSVTISTGVCFFYSMLIAMLGIGDYKSLYTFVALIPMSYLYYTLINRFSSGQNRRRSNFFYFDDSRLTKRLYGFYLKKKIHLLLPD